jgi:spoIIIJ-associated protein
MPAEEDQALAAEPAERVRAILERIVDELDVDASVEVSEEPDEIIGRVEGEDLGLLIGRRGQTIDAVQLLCYRAAFRGRQDRKRVTVDAAGYRERRRDAVERQAERAAERALKTGNEIELEPMTPTERRVVHQHLKDRAGIETFSEGDEPERCVVVAPLLSD